MSSTSISNNDVINAISIACRTYIERSSNNNCSSTAQQSEARRALVASVRDKLKGAVDLSQPNTANRTPLSEALRTGVAELVALLLHHQKSIVDVAEPISGFSPLVVALLNAHTVDQLASVRLLLAADADISTLSWTRVYDDTDTDHDVVVEDHYAALLRYRDALKAAGSNADALTRCGPIPVTYAVWYWLEYRRSLGIVGEALARMPPPLRTIQLLGTVGQRLAKHAFVRPCVAFFHDREGREEPLVLAFCGSSGHGKTDMATRFAEACSLDSSASYVLNCQTEADSLNAMLGAAAGYAGCQLSGPLNSFFRANSKRDAVLVLDEFDRANVKAREAFLAVFGSGTYRDRMTHDVYDLRRLIIILTTNVADSVIERYVEQNEELVSDGNAFNADAAFWERHSKALQADIRTRLSDQFGPPLTGRIAAIVPFVFFSPIEAACVADQLINTLQWRYRKPANEERKFGQLHLRLLGDSCGYFARRYFERDAQKEGARTIRSAINKEIVSEVAVLCLGDKLPIDADSKLTNLWCFPSGSSRFEIELVKPSALVHQERPKPDLAKQLHNNIIDKRKKAEAEAAAAAAAAAAAPAGLLQAPTDLM